MKTQKEKATKFKYLHDNPESFIMPNPWDMGTAKLLAELGFETPLGEFIRSAKEIKENGTSKFADTAVPFSKLMEVFKD